MRHHHTVGAVVVLALFSATSLSGQVIAADSSSRAPDRLSLSFGGRWMKPVGAFARNVSFGVGGGLSVGYHLRGFEQLAFHTELSHHWYGWEAKRVQLSPTANRVFVDMSTTNNIFVLTLGPELALRRGPLRPYVLWHAGYSNFYTKSTVKDENTGSSFAESTNMDDGGWAIEYGGGLRLASKKKPGKMRVSIDLGGRMTINGTRRYLRSGDIVDQPDGSLVFNVRRTPANFFQFALGITASEL